MTELRGKISAGPCTTGLHGIQVVGWLLSSRIVGYDEVPFDEELAPPPEESGAGELHTVSLTKFLGAEQEKKPTSPGGHGLHDSGSIVTRYIAPFDDSADRGVRPPLVRAARCGSGTRGRRRETSCGCSSRGRRDTQIGRAFQTC